ncbi:CopD family protein [Candidatus Nitrosotenuis chungbukensis]|nr:CopD family protein [Candidatus Nitrosotenuis chungbukensis]
MIATGIFNAHQMLIRPDFLFSTSYGMLLVIKIIFVIGLLVAFGVHVRIIRKEVEQKIMSKQPSDSQITKTTHKDNNRRPSNCGPFCRGFIYGLIIGCWSLSFLEFLFHSRYQFYLHRTCIR